MVAANLTKIFLMFLVLRIGNSCAQPHQGDKRPPAANEIFIQLRGSSLMNLKGEIHDVSATSQLNNGRPGGRKMMLKTVFNKDEQVKMDILNVEDADVSGGGHFVGHCEKGSSKGKCNKHSDTRSNPVKSKYVGFSGFSADYHVPKSHPPKNN